MRGFDVSSAERCALRVPVGVFVRFGVCISIARPYLRAVVMPMTDFSQLPYFDSRGDANTMRS